jgi:hypothetical protein
LSWIGIGWGASIFLGSFLVQSNTHDECNLLDVFKSAEECKAEADEQRSSAATGMAMGGLLTVAGVVGLILANTDTSDSTQSTVDPNPQRHSADSKCEDIENRVTRYNCFREKRY